MSAVIQTSKLNKIYEGSLKGQDVHALKDLSLEVMKGEIFAYLGPNGSGKTTTIKMFLGLLFPTSGNIKIFGTSDTGSARVKRQIGYLPEGAYYPDFLKGDEVLRFYGHLYGLGGAELNKRVDNVLEVVGMTKVRKRLLKGYSKGMRQRIGLAQALINNPDILILDEPTTGLDPIARKEIRDILSNLRDAGKTLFISSHELLEVELISDRVGILYEGSLRTIGKLDDLLTERDTAIKVSGYSSEMSSFFTESSIKVDDVVGEKAMLRVPSDKQLYDVLDMCKSKNLAVETVAPNRETLEELFVRVVEEAQAAQ